MSLSKSDEETSVHIEDGAGKTLVQAFQAG